ncbi:chemotaxis protein methyltransferase CheR [Bacillus sp. TS-2]|nr:chemotaxis protein methyltransferase CheR [Bacillus sp. TS-2]
MEQDYEQFIQNIYKATNIDLHQYKETQMKRRLTTLKSKHGFSTFADFFIAMKQKPELLDEFLDRMTINVSEFYRNPSRWEILKSTILPEILKTSNKNSLKVWSAACSSGEEPYTMAMLLSEFLPLKENMILATDLDQNIIEQAKRGFYLEKAVQNVPNIHLDRYFQKKDLGYQLNQSLMKSVTFKKQNLLADPFDSSFDLIVCRNVMIYFTEEAKHQLYLKFSKALKPGGILFVGSTEQIFHSKKYNLEAEETFFYKKII